MLALAHRSRRLVALKRATLTPLAFIHRSAWKQSSPKFIYSSQESFERRAKAVGALIPFARVEAQGGCARRGHPCEGNQDCCGELVCRSRGPGEAKRCKRRPRDDD